MKPLRIATRGSALALAQARMIGTAVEAATSKANTSASLIGATLSGRMRNGPPCYRTGDLHEVQGPRPVPAHERNLGIRRGLPPLKFHDFLQVIRLARNALPLPVAPPLTRTQDRDPGSWGGAQGGSDPR